VEGRIVITAEPEAAAAEQERTSAERVAAMVIDCKMKASKMDCLSIMRSLGRSLHLNPIDWVMLASTALGIGPLSEDGRTIEVANPEELRRKLEELRSRGGDP
jgi:hypothetical protein